MSKQNVKVKPFNDKSQSTRFKIKGDVTRLKEKKDTTAALYSLTIWDN